MTVGLETFKDPCTLSQLLFPDLEAGLDAFPCL
jgi:hypothetical protein